MSWPTGSVPGHITQFRTQWNACASWASAGGLLAQIHFGFCNVTGVRGTADALPAMLIDSAPIKRTPFAEGAQGVMGGVFNIVLFSDITLCPFAANLEALADSIISDLTAQEVGMLWGETSRDDASDPSAAETNADTAGTVNNFRSIKLSIPWGIQP
jgi:hypothetical protein